jgi:hypothetical protein
MPLRLPFGRALLPYILAHHRFIPVSPSRPDTGALRPQLATPQPLLDRRHAREDFAGRQTFDALDQLGRAVARHRLHQKMDGIFVRTHFEKSHVVPLGDVSADVAEDGVACRVNDDPTICCGTDNRVHQGRNVVSFMSIVAHSSDDNTPGKAEASFEESDPRD